MTSPTRTKPHCAECAPPADLYDGVYDASLKGRWAHRTVHGLIVVVEGLGDRKGTVAVRAEHPGGKRQDDLPITTLHSNYRRLASS